MTRFLPSFLGTLCHLRDDQRGNVAAMFAALALPLVGATGIAVDMYRIQSFKTDVREAADAGVLAAARAKTLDRSLTEAQMTTIARAHVDANLRSNDQYDIQEFSISYNAETGDTDLTLKTNAPTLLMGIVGKKDHSFLTQPSARVMPPRELEIMLVLDNTYSMVGQKLETLRTASKDLVTTVMTEKKIKENVKMGVVPFSQWVNVGKNRRNANWIDVPADSSKTENKCWNTYPNMVKSGCVKKTCSSTKDGVKVTWTCTKCSSVKKGKPVKVCKDVTKHTKFYGCVGSRTSPYNVEDTSYTTRKVPGLMNTRCANEIRPLTNDRRKVLKTLDKMKVQGSNTFIAPGLVWGYRLISPSAPFKEGMTYDTMSNEDGVKAIVLMTDGANTVTSSGKNHWKYDPGESNDLLEDTCDEVKSKDIEIYTIAFEVTDNTIRQLLKQCATTPSNYFDAKDAAALKEAFGSVALSLTELALTK